MPMGDCTRSLAVLSSRARSCRDREAEQHIDQVAPVGRVGDPDHGVLRRDFLDAALQVAACRHRRAGAPW